jgi:deoxyribodipyrimidine photo-lyase
MICNPSRAAALGQLDEFTSIAPLYARDRNHVKPEHPSVSRLSPAIRHRLITEDEVAAAVLRVHPFARVEKFVQEVYWRRYWKSWLSLRPEVWTHYQDSLAEPSDHARLQEIENARTGNAVIDHFANELVSTGYLHNHARMWFAAWWVHEARLPWQLGAAFFYRHLLDGDPASNTLSWRWVAGLQTPGKTYLARRSNLEKYLAPGMLESLSQGLSAFDNPVAFDPEPVSKPPITRNDWPLEILTVSPATGLWIHEEDLSLENSPLGPQSFSSIIVTGDVATWNQFRFPTTKRQWLADALKDAAMRAELRWQSPVTFEIQKTIHDSLVSWAKANALEQVAAVRPEVGPLHDALPAIRASLAQAGVRLVLTDRPEDLRIRHFASGGFFQFWERLRKTFGANSCKNIPSTNPQLSIGFPP